MDTNFIQFLLRIIIVSSLAINAVIFGSSFFEEVITDQPVMSFWTSASFVFALGMIDVKKIENMAFWTLSALQAFNLVYLFSGKFSSPAFYYPSSLPTTCFFISLVLFHKLKSYKSFEARYFGFYAFFIMGAIPLLGLFGNVLHMPTILDQNSVSPSIGLSLVTSILGFLTVLIYGAKNTPSSLLNTKAFITSFECFYLQIFASLFLSVGLFHLLNWSLYNCLAISFTLSVFLFYAISLKRIQQGKDEQLITVCSVEKTIKPERPQATNEWLSLEAFLQEKGYIISHGYSPLITKKIKVDRIVQKLNVTEKTPIDDK